MSEQQLDPARNGTEQRLDAVLAELRALRVAMTPVSIEKTADGLIDIRESERPKRRRG